MLYFKQLVVHRKRKHGWVVVKWLILIYGEIIAHVTIMAYQLFKLFLN